MSGLLLNMCSVHDCASTCKICQDAIKKECDAYLQGQSSSVGFQPCFDAGKETGCQEPDCAASCLKCQEYINPGIAAGKQKARAVPNCSVPGSSSKTKSSSDNDKYSTGSASGSFSVEDVLGERRPTIHCGCKTRNNMFKKRARCPLHKFFQI